jgi:hypothetical protein
MAILTDVSWQDYLCDTHGLRSSDAKVMIKSPKHFRHAMDNPSERDETSAIRIGHGAHSLLEDPDNFDDNFAVLPDLHLDARNVDAKGRASKSKNTSAYKNVLYPEWKESIFGKEELSASEYDRVRGIVSAIHDDPLAGPIVKECTKEVTLTWEMGGVHCKCRIDLLCLEKGYFADTKTTKDISMFSFGKDFANYLYGFQLSWYWLGLHHNGLSDFECQMICVENTAPHDTAVIPWEHLAVVVEAERERIAYVIDKYKECQSTNQWPGCARGEPYELHIPNWAMPQGDGLDWS